MESSASYLGSSDEMSATPLASEDSGLVMVAAAEDDRTEIANTASVPAATAMDATDAPAIFSDGLCLSQSPPHAATRPASRQRTASAGGQKRGASESGRSPRGRPDSPWLDDTRAVHRRIQCDPQAPSLGALHGQLEADREHVAMLKDAFETM